MKFKKPFVALITFVLMVSACGPQTEVIDFDKNKAGGIFEIDPDGKEYKFYNSDQVFKLNTSTAITFADFKQIQRSKSQDMMVPPLNFELTEAGGKKFREMTERNIQKQLCFVIGDKIMAAPIVQGVVPSGFGSISIQDEKGIKEIIDYLKK